jgi:hypothetical protein
LDKKAGGVVQGVGPEFKPQNHKKKKKVPWIFYFKMLLIIFFFLDLIKGWRHGSSGEALSANSSTKNKQTKKDLIRALLRGKSSPT